MVGKPVDAIGAVRATVRLLPPAIHNLACVAYQAEATGSPVRLYPGRGFCLNRTGAALFSSSECVACHAVQVLLGPHGRLRPVGSLHLSQDRLDVNLNRSFSHSKLTGNQLV